MLKRELKVNFKSFMVWLLIMIIIFGIVFAVYPSLKTNGEAMDAMMSMFPSEMLEMFNMDLVGLDSFYSWCVTEGYMMLIILGSCFSIILGTTLVLKEENDKTIDFLLSKPVTRNQILNNKILSGFIYITIFNIIIYLVSTLGIIISGDGNIKVWSLVVLASLIVQVFFYLFGLLISMFFKKTRKSMSIGLGVVIGTYIINSLSSLTDELEFLKYLSPYSYIDIRNVIIKQTFNIYLLLIVLISGIVCLLTTYYLYNKKEMK